MKKTLKNITSFSMILILLVSSLQVGLYKMECIMSGNVSLSLSEFDSCDKSNQILSDKCCNFDHVTFDLDFDASVNFKTFKSNIASSFILQKDLPLLKSVLKTDNFNNYTNLPPPGGIDLLKKVQVFRL